MSDTQSAPGRSIAVRGQGHAVPTDQVPQPLSICVLDAVLWHVDKQGVRALRVVSYVWVRHEVRVADAPAPTVEHQLGVVLTPKNLPVWCELFEVPVTTHEVRN